MPQLITIRDWNDHFEKSQSRKIEGPLPWVAMPTKHDGKGYRRVMAAGPDIYAAWVCLVQVGAKCKRRGVLADESGPLSTFDLHLKTSLPESVIERAIPILASKEIGWICVSEYHETGSEVAIEDRTGQDITEQDSCCAASAELGLNGQPATAAPSEFSFPTTGRNAKEWTLTAAKLAEYIDAYPALDVPAEMRNARQWCRDKARNRKTAGGMQAFLTGWLNRSTNKGRGKDAPIAGFQKVSASEFRKLHEDGKFKEGPTRAQSDPSWVYGTLRDGSKVECKDYPVRA